MNLSQRPNTSTTAILAVILFTASGMKAWSDPAPQGPIQTVVYEVPSGTTVTVELLDRAIAETEQNPDITAEIKTQVIENLRAAVKNLQSAADAETRLNTFSVEAKTAAERAEQLKTQLAEMKDRKPVVDPGMDLAELEQLLPTTDLKLSGFKKDRKDAEAKLQSRAARRKEIRTSLATIEEKIADVMTQLKTIAAGEATPQSQSQTARLVTRRMMLETEKPALEGELAKYDAEEAADLVRLQMDVATANASYTEKFVTLLQQRINAAREAAAEEAVRKARREAIAADPELKEYAEQNQELAEHAKTIAESLAETESKLKVATKTYEDLLRQFDQTKKKVDSVGLTSSVGALLRKQRTSLPDVGERRDAVADRQELINDTQYQLFEYEEVQQDLSKVDSAIEEILADATRDSSDQGVALLESAARDLVERKREYLDDLTRSTGQYFDTLIELDTVDRQIIKLEADYENYIDQRVLWIRSGPALTAGVTVNESDSWLLSTDHWEDAYAILVADAKRRTVLYLLCFALVGLLYFRGRAVRLSIRQLGEKAEKANCLSILPTMRGIWLTTLVSLAWPLACLFVGWRLGRCAGESEFTAAIGQGLKVAGLLWASVELIRQICRPKGIGESHFRWPSHATATFRREARICMILVLPIAFVTATLAASNGAHERGDVQRVAFIVGMCVIGYTIFRLLRPAGVLRDRFAANSSGIAAKAKYVFAVFGAALPLSLALLAVTGYHYTAQALFWRLFATLDFLALLLVMRSILYRMLLLRRRHLCMEQARQRAAAAKSESESGGENHPVAGIVTENVQSDISAHSLQSRNLVSASVLSVAIIGLWMIWIGVFPALSMIGNYPLWGKSETAKVAEVSTPASPMPTPTPGGLPEASATTASSDEVLVSSVTMSDLALAILIVVITIVLFRNGPGLLEMSVLQQLPLDPSVRYAVTTLVSYVIVMIGTVAACSTIGLQWSQIQWLVTALTFGLAFGLQEMFANFVAGLIILLERPIRVGDIVTVDDVTGVVSRIRIRATSITNWDRKEYVVPNKEFITGRLLNWTLSDHVNRIVVEIGLAYGSDTEKARELLLKVANAHPTVLKDPAAMATFEGFGDNSLNLVLRAFLPTLENRLQIIHELHTAIDQEFRKANLEIAFPQRDLHIRTMSTVPALVLQPGGDEGENVDDKLREAA